MAHPWAAFLMGLFLGVMVILAVLEVVASWLCWWWRGGYVVDQLTEAEADQYLIDEQFAEITEGEDAR